MKAEPLPTRWEAFVFTSKVQALRIRRTFLNWRRPVAACTFGDPSDFDVLLAESRTPLFSETDEREKRLQLGKVHNLRLVAQKFDRIVVAKGNLLSFWNLVGRPSRSQGFVEGRQIQEGCVIPAIAGGICQLSNALYDVALKSGFEIVERHPHSRALARAAWSLGRDATVAWNHIDLRVCAAQDTIIRTTLTKDELVVAVYGQAANKRVGLTVLQQDQTTANSCETCGMSDCFQHQQIDHSIVNEKTAALVDQVWPEFVSIVNECDSVFLPIDGAKFRLKRYCWPLDNSVKIVESRAIALRRSWSSRKLAEQGAARQKALLQFDKTLAEDFARRIPFDTTHLIVQQNLLPHLWKIGALGGRTFDVLMVRRPIATLQKILDEQLKLHPERKLLGDFRASEDLVRAETEALANARKIYTPHSEIANEFKERAEKLDWCLPLAQGQTPGERIAFPGPTIARKGAYELREVAQELGMAVMAGGSELEGAEFWKGIDMKKPTGYWLDGCCVVVQPALLEDQPRKLLKAVTEGVPVIATKGCGLEGVEGVITIPDNRPETICKALHDLTDSK